MEHRSITVLPGVIQVVPREELEPKRRVDVRWLLRGVGSSVGVSVDVGSSVGVDIASSPTPR
jgi:hypothetical protein